MLIWRKLVILLIGLLLCTIGALLRAPMALANPAALANPTAVVSVTPTSLSDPLENNDRVANAARIAWGVAYTLNLICPDSRPAACISGDHDFLLTNVKAGEPFVALTYDLGPGADTTIALYQPVAGWVDPSTGIEGWKLIYGNDDATVGHTLRSQVLFNPTWSGDLLIIIAPSSRTNPAYIPEATAQFASYHLIIGSPFLPAVQQVLAQQTEATSSQSSKPAPTHRPTSQAPIGATVIPTVLASGNDPEEIIHESCLTGQAEVVNPNGSRFSAAALPANDRRYLMIYPKGTQVALLGSCYLGWVKVRPLTAVSPGWMYAPDLQLIEQTILTPTISSSIVATATDILSAEPTIVPTEPNPLRLFEITALPTQIALAPTSQPHQAISIAVRVQDNSEQPISAVRVQLIDVVGHILREGTTDAQGQIILVGDLAANNTVWVQIPAAGLIIPVDRAKPNLTVNISG